MAWRGAEPGEGGSEGGWQGSEGPGEMARRRREVVKGPVRGGRIKFPLLTLACLLLPATVSGLFFFKFPNPAKISTDSFFELSYLFWLSVYCEKRVLATESIRFGLDLFNKVYFSQHMFF